MHHRIEVNAFTVDFARARERMVEEQVACRGVSDARLLCAMRAVPREVFVAPCFEEFAYEDGPLPIGENQTISQPYVTALMIEAADLRGHERVLEVGAGSGYAAAIVSRIARRVFAIERYRSLVMVAQWRLASLYYGNIDLRAGDGTKGWPQAAPFDAILVSAAARKVPQGLKDQLAIGGRLIIPIGEEERLQSLRRITRTSNAGYEERCLGTVMFVPLVGAG